MHAHNNLLDRVQIPLAFRFAFAILESLKRNRRNEMKAMTLIEAIEMGYLHRQGKYKGAPWICGGKQYPTAKEALAAANASMLAHA